MKTKIIAICGEAGSGKDTILQKLLKIRPDFKEIVSCTTRPPREGELHGVNYYFLNEKEFKEKIFSGKMLEYTSFNGWYYGTSLIELYPDHVNVGVFNPAGISELIDNPNIDLKVIRVCVNDKTRLIRQLNREDNPNVAEIVRRYQTDKNDFALFNLLSDNLLLYNETQIDLDRSPYIILDYCGSWAD